MELIRAFSTAASPPLQPMETAGAGAGGKRNSLRKYLSNDPLKMYVAFRIWNSYLLSREPRDRNAACDRFMDKMSSLTGVFHNEAMSFDRETGKPKHFQAGSLYFKGAPSEDTRLDLWFPDNRRTEEECVCLCVPLPVDYLLSEQAE